MNKKYEVHNQLTGLLEEAATWEEAQQLRARIRAEYIEDRVDPLFQISVLVQNEDQSWTQSLADENGEPLIAAEPEPIEPTQEEPDSV